MDDNEIAKKKQRSGNKRGDRQLTLPLGKALLVGVLIFIGAFYWGNRTPSLQLSDLKNLTQRKQSPGSLNFASVQQLYELLYRNFDGKLDINKLQTGMEQGLVNATGDPHTEFFTASQAKDFMNDLDGKLSGVGIEIGKKNNQLVVITPVAGTPADKAGLRAGDQIISVDGQDTSTWSVDQAASKIRGQAGTVVKLTVVRAGNTLDFKITRANITVPSVTSKIVDGNIGYLQISRFGDDTVSLATDAANNFKSKNVKGVILDLRNNGGGLLNSAVGVSSLWLNNQVVVSEKTGGVTQDTLYSQDDAPLAGIPTIVLVNGGSASASEITAGALRDNGAAKLVGETTFGKGSVQQTINLKDGGVLKVTVAHWYTPKGVNIDKEGIKPDIMVKLTDADYNASRDPQMARALKELGH